jgi:hypothetical protein
MCHPLSKTRANTARRGTVGVPSPRDILRAHAVTVKECHFQTKCSAANSGLFDHLVGRRPAMDFWGDIPVSGETIASNPR